MLHCSQLLYPDIWLLYVSYSVSMKALPVYATTKEDFYAAQCSLCADLITPENKAPDYDCSYWDRGGSTWCLWMGGLSGLCLCVEPSVELRFLRARCEYLTCVCHHAASTAARWREPNRRMLRGGMRCSDPNSRRATSTSLSKGMRLWPAAGVSRPASPPQATEQQPHAATVQALSTPIGLSAALESARLAKYDDALRGLGCEIVQDLADVEDQDLVELGLKKIEVTRLRRLQMPQAVGSLGGSE
jgi:hypothetical protein